MLWELGTGAGAVACFCGPFVGISRSVAPVLLVTLPSESRAELWGCFLASCFIQGYVFGLQTGTGWLQSAAVALPFFCEPQMSWGTRGILCCCCWVWIWEGDGENAGKVFPFLPQLFIADYPVLKPLWGVNALSQQFRVDVEWVLELPLLIYFEDLRVFYKELPLLWKTSRRSWVLGYVLFQKNPKFQSYLTEGSAISTLSSFLSFFYCV